MANVATITPLNQFFDTNGSPLNSGYLYFGSPNQDPEQFPVQMYWDEAGTVPALQPIRTISGYPSRAGSPAIIYGPDSYSMRVRNSASVQVLYAPNLGGLASSASLAASGGSALVGFIQSGAGAVARTAQAKMRDFVSVQDFGAVGDGVTDDTVAVQAALTAHLDVYFPPGNYLLSATLTARPKARLHGAGAENTILQRTANYGDTIQIGSLGNGANNFEITGLWFYKPQTYVAGTTTTITHPVTAGAAHIKIFGAQEGRVSECFFYNMPYAITAESSSLLRIERNNFIGIWDHLIAGLQEGIAAIYLKSDGTNINVLVTIAGNHISGGYFSVSRNITLGTINFNATEQIGTRYGVMVDSCEGLHIHDNYMGGQNDYCILLQPSQILAAVKIYGNFFDSGLAGVIRAFTTGATKWVVGLQIFGNNFNGQLIGLEAIRVDYPSSNKSVVGMLVADNYIENYLKTPIALVGVVSATIIHNTLTNYHARGGGTGDPDYASGIRVYAGAQKVFSTLNSYGGGINDMSATNNCQYGIFFNAPTLGSAINEQTISLGLAGGFIINGGSWQNDKRIVVFTAAGNYTSTGNEDVIIVNKTVAASTQINAPSAVDAGYTLTFKDGKGDAAANNLQFIGVVDGVANPVYATNYISKTVIWNGTEWNVIG